LHAARARRQQLHLHRVAVALLAANPLGDGQCTELPVVPRARGRLPIVLEIGGRERDKPAPGPVLETGMPHGVPMQ
jgi:hypothetical protein